MRLRATALPSFLVAVKPKRGGLPADGTSRSAASRSCPALSALISALMGRSLPVRARISITKPGVDHRRPPRTRRNSARRFSVAMAIWCIRSPNDQEPPRRGRRVATRPAAQSVALRPVLSSGIPHQLGEALGPRSGRQALAALGAATRNDVAAADGRHAGAEAVPALTHKLARLIGPLHDTFSISRLGGRAAGPIPKVQRRRCNTNRRRRFPARSPVAVRPYLRMSAGLIWVPSRQVNFTALPKRPPPGPYWPRGPAGSAGNRAAVPGMCQGQSRHSRRGSLPGRERAMKWLLFLLAFAGALAVGFFGVLGLV